MVYQDSRPIPVNMAMTLDELKRQNASAEAPPDPAATDPEQTADGAQTGSTELPEGDGQTGDTGQPADVPEWMLSDDQASQQTADSSDSVPVQTLISVRRKLKGRVSDRDREIDRLRQENEALRQGKKPEAGPDTPATSLPPRPRRDDFLTATDPDAAYDAAIDEWNDRKLDQRLAKFRQTTSEQQQQSEQQRQVQQAVDQHIDRAAQLVADKFITAEEWTDADAFIRQSVEMISPGNGDNAVDAFITRLGAGSEKVIIALSRNAQYMDEFRHSLRSDPSGLAAMAYLGGLKNRFESAATRKRVSAAPRPGSRVSGDTPPPAGGSDKRLYDAAHKAGNRQKAFDIKRQAKARGVDTSTW